MDAVPLLGPSQHGVQRLRRGLREVLLHLLIDQRFGLRRIYRVGGSDVVVSPQGLRHGIDGVGPAVGSTPLVEALAGVPDKMTSGYRKYMI